MGDNRSRILAEARRILEQQDVSSLDRETLVKLLDILTLALERQAPNDTESLQTVASQLLSNHTLISLLEQQTDELDALKKLSINLTSSLDLPDVLDAVVTEAMRLIDNAREHNYWLVLAGHEMNDSGSQTTRLSMLKKLIEYAQDPANGIWLAPVGTVGRYVQGIGGDRGIRR